MSGLPRAASRRLLLLPAVVVALGLAVPAGASAARFQPVLGEADGLSLVVRGNTQRLRFAPQAARAYRKRLAGRQVTVRCFRERETPAGAFDRQTESGQQLRLPRRPRSILLGSPQDTGYGDWCRIGRRGVPIAIVPGTSVGRRYLDELTTSGRLTFASITASPNADEDPDAPVPVAEVVQRSGGLIIALEGPDASPPPGRAGYWTDGTRMVIAATTLGGKRLFTDGRTDTTTVTSNVQLARDDDAEGVDAVFLWRTADGGDRRP